MHRRASARGAFVVKNIYFLFFLFFEWPIVLLRTLISQLDCVEPFETALKLQFGPQPLIPIEFHYMEKNPGMFSLISSLISFQLRKKDMNILNGMGVSKLSGNLILELTNPLTEIK